MTPNRKLSVVNNTQPDPPYPPEIKARGWVFDIDLEQLEQSDTWALASAEQQAWLLKLWLLSWKQAPCGSYPNDDALIAARIGMDPRAFAVHRDVLMRGWRLHADGRLYHPAITARVLTMIAKRRKDADRMAAHRARRDEPDGANVTRDSREVTREFTVSSTPTPTPTPLPTPTVAGLPPPESSSGGLGTTQGDTHAQREKRAARASRGASVSLDALVAEGVEREHAQSWLTTRTAKRLPLTPTAWSGIKREAEAAGISPATAVAFAATNSWAGFKAAWLQRPDTQRPTGQKSTEAAQARASRITALLGHKEPTRDA